MKKIFFVLISLGFIIAIVCFYKINDSFKLQMESSHFKFYSYSRDKKCLEDLSKALEDNYDKISKNLNVSLKDKTIIEIYPDIKAFHNAIGSPNAPNWIVGTGWENKIKIVSPLNPGKQHTYDSLLQVIVHEFTHVAISNINCNLESIPIWLNEGIASYEAKQLSNTSRNIIKEKLSSNDVPSLSEMNPSNFPQVLGYVFSYTAIEYIVETYGYDTLISLIKSPADLDKILGQNLLEFEKNWNIYLKETYNM